MTEDVTLNDSDMEDEASESEPVPTAKKVSKAGIIYLSSLPPGMNVKQIREYFGAFGEVNRSFLQPEKKKWKGRGKPKNQTFIEGWIEFRKRRHAKRVAANLNTQPVGGKKTKVYHDFLWNIKYLPGFQWVHLNERLAYERISMKQKLRTEISAAKRETDFFAKNVDLGKKLKRKGIIGATKKAGSTETQHDEGEGPNTAQMDTSPVDTSSSKSVNKTKPSRSSKAAEAPAPKPKPAPADRTAFLKSLFQR